MRTFETTATIDDALHLTLHEPLPFSAGRECRVVILFEAVEENQSPAWTAEFLESIRIDDPSFVRPDQGTFSPVKPLDP